MDQEFGKNTLPLKAPRLNPGQRWLLAGLLLFYVIQSLFADVLWPAGKIVFDSTYSAMYQFRAFDRNFPIDTAFRYPRGGTGEEYQSLAYMAVLHLFYSIIRNRWLCLRIMSIVFSTLSLFFAFRLGSVLFSKPIAFISVFLLATSPAYALSMRSFGFIPLTQLVVIVFCYLAVTISPGVKGMIRILLLTFLAVCSLSLYAPGKLVIFLPILFFGIYWKTEWKKLVMYAAAFAMLIVILDSSLPGPSLSFRNLLARPTSGEWLYRYGEFAPAGFANSFLRNAGDARDYLLSRNRQFFEPRNQRSKLYNPLYTPFLIAGLIICVARRTKSNLYLLLLFIIFFLPPLGTNNLDPRRVLMSLFPINLLIALGMWLWAKSLLVLADRYNKHRVAVIFALLSLIAVGIYDTHEFLFKVSRPVYNLPRNQLKLLAQFISEKIPEVDWIRSHRSMENLIWGNPFYNPNPPPPVSPSSINPDKLRHLRALTDSRIFAFFEPRNIGTDSNRDDLFGRISGALDAGASLLYIFIPPELSPKEEDVKWARLQLPDNFRLSSISGTPLEYVLLTRNDEIPANLLLTESPGFATSATDYDGCELRLKDALTDGEPTTGWETNISGHTEPPWLEVDFGAGNAQVVQALSIRPIAHPPFPFFTEAELWASGNDSDWRLLTVIREDKPVYSSQWRVHSFINKRPYRRYRLKITDDLGEETHRHVTIADLAFFDSRENLLLRYRTGEAIHLED